MNALRDVLRDILRALGEAGFEAALVGGLAVGLRAEERFTKDIDLAVAVSSDEEAEGLLRHLLQIGYQPTAVIEQVKTKRLATVRLRQSRSPSPDQRIDLLFASSGIEREIVEAAQIIRVARDLSVPVASRAHLLALKLLSFDDRNRPQDRIDIHALLKELREKELEVTRKALKLIKKRGFHRGRDLLKELEKFRSGI
jgi:predicted nucleotidyltransferase